MATDGRIDELERVIAQVLAEVKRDPSLPARIAPGTNLLQEVGLDSLELTDLVLRLEDALGLTVDYERFNLRHLHSLAAFAEFLAG
jgi:acyl carrier protein